MLQARGRSDASTLLGSSVAMGSVAMGSVAMGSGDAADSGPPALGPEEGQVDEVAGLVIARAEREPEAAQIQLGHALERRH